MSARTVAEAGNFQPASALFEILSRSEKFEVKEYTEDVPVEAVYNGYPYHGQEREIIKFDYHLPGGRKGFSPSITAEVEHRLSSGIVLISTDGSSSRFEQLMEELESVIPDSVTEELRIVSREDLSALFRQGQIGEMGLRRIGSTEEKTLRENIIEKVGEDGEFDIRNHEILFARVAFTHEEFGGECIVEFDSNSLRIVSGNSKGVRYATQLIEQFLFYPCQ